MISLFILVDKNQFVAVMYTRTLYDSIYGEMYATIYKIMSSLFANPLNES